MDNSFALERALAGRALTLAGWEAERSGAYRLPVGRAVEARAEPVAGGTAGVAGSD